MAQFTIDTQNFRDLYETAHIIQSLLKYNQKELEFCPIKDYEELQEKYNALKMKFAECEEELETAKQKLDDELAKNASLELKQRKK